MDELVRMQHRFIIGLLNLRRSEGRADEADEIAQVVRDQIKAYRVEGYCYVHYADALEQDLLEAEKRSLL